MCAWEDRCWSDSFSRGLGKQQGFSQISDTEAEQCLGLVAGQCTFPVHGAGAVGTGSFFAYCGSAAVSSA